MYILFKLIIFHKDKNKKKEKHDCFSFFKGSYVNKYYFTGILSMCFW